MALKVGDPYHEPPTPRRMTLEELAPQLRELLTGVIRPLDAADGVTDGIIHKDTALAYLRANDPHNPLIRLIQAKPGDFRITQEDIAAEAQRFAARVDKNNNTFVDTNEVITDPMVFASLRNLVNNAPQVRR